MKIFLISLSVVSSLLMIVVILLQQGKGADLGAAFGRGAQGGLFDSSGKANFLTRITKWLAVVFLFSSLSLSIYLGEENRSGVLQELQGEGAVIAEGDDAVILGSDADESGGDADLIVGDDDADGAGDDDVILGETPN